MFQGGSQAYAEPTDDMMVRRVAEILARNIEEIDDPTVIEEIASCFDHAATIETAETAIGLYCKAVPHEGFTLSISHGATTHGGDEPPPLAESVAAMRRFLQTIQEP
jgi:hypothetical protein